uniref:IS3 family transposase n=1 Tax=Humisphaera borealis TaxID=2807512 RepID=UPI0036F1DFBB
MAMRRRKFTREFKLGAVKLVHQQGRSVMQAAKDLGVDPKCIREWIEKYTADPDSASPAAMAKELQQLRTENARLRMEREILKKATAFLCQPAGVRFAFIASTLDDYPLAACCRVLSVTRSGFYAWRCRADSERQRRRQELLVRIRDVHEANRQVYGSPRIYQVLKSEGQSVCENTVAAIMKQAQIRAKGRRRFVPRTTDSGHGQPVATNVLDRQFAAEGPDRKWVADITYIETAEGWLYLAGVLDLYSRKIVGWSMTQHMRTELVAEALQMAIAQRQPCKGLLHHSDRGVPYASEDYQHLLQSHGMVVSMSDPGECWDNATMESFWSTLKSELMEGTRYATRAEARQSIFEYIEVFYNRKRLHSTLGYQSPESFEASRS